MIQDNIPEYLKIDITTNKKLDAEELLKPKLTKKSIFHLNKDCKCQGHNLNYEKGCYYNCSCTPWCVKYCRLRDFNKPKYESLYDVDEGIYCERLRMLENLNEIETELINNIKNNKISIEEFRQKNNEIQTLKRKIIEDKHL